MTEPRELTLLTHAQRALAEARSVDEVKQLRDKAELVKAYARKAKLGQHIVVEACVIKVQAERKLGQMLLTLGLANAAPGNQHTGPRERPANVVFLRDLGITKSDSSRSQQLASLPDDVFERYLQDSLQSQREPTTASLLRLARERRAKAKRPHRAVPDPGDRIVSSLEELLRAKKKFATIYADPPWAYRNQGTRAATDNHYPTMPVAAICAEPVANLCEDEAHLHLWTTNGFLPAAFQVLAAWGFEYKSCFIWVKPQLGIGNYWRVSHEFLLLGVRGNLPFRDRGQQSWISCDRTGHSRKPAVIRQLVEKVSPGPYLELYGREEPPGPAWTVYGNQVERGLPFPEEPPSEEAP